MGEEAPEVVLNGLEEISLPVVGLKSGATQTATVVGDKTFVVEGFVDGVNVKIFDHITGSCVIPRVLGEKPLQSEGHLAALCGNDRILIVKKDVPFEDSIWFLEVDTPFVHEHKKSLGMDVVAWSKGVTGDAPKPIVISGPSGVGKGTLIARLMNEYPLNYGFSVSHTTRAPREKEVNGVHYHFSDRSSMEKDIADGKFLEFASVHGNLYGTSIEAVEVVTDSGKRCILDIDVQGARSVRASSLEAIFIFLCPPSFEELEKRLRARGTETEEQVLKRLRNARAELNEGKSSGLFDHILVNDDLDACYENLKKLIASDGSTDVSHQHQTCVKDSKVSVRDIFAEQDQKVLFCCESFGLEAGAPKKFALDLSSCKGGAPGRTRGLHFYAVGS